MLVVGESVGLEGVGEDLVFGGELFDLLVYLVVVAVDHELWSGLGDEVLKVEEVSAYLGLEVGEVEEAEGADFCSHNEDLVVSWRAHLSDL